MTTEPEKPKHLVCAIYTRKSTSEGLDQDFNSLDNQRESAQNYIKSQQHEGWSASEEFYDDGGFTGANIERPALQKLLTHIKEGKINCVVVYKVDRLSRSLLDFSQLLEFFDKHGVVFVSITQHFNTNTSMGRLTLNILLSFAQFEREIISERVRDKMGAARKRGQWTGGFIPFGYRKHPKEPRKIVVDTKESEIVRKMFDLYLGPTGSALEVTRILNTEGYRTRSWTTKTGKPSGKMKFSINRTLYILKNHIYAGKVNFKGQIYPSQQPTIIDEETFTKVQEKIIHNRTERKAYKNKDCSGLLSRLIKCNACGNDMLHTYTLKNGRHKYRYYVCSNAKKRGYNECPNKSVNAQTIEDAVLDHSRKILVDNTDETFKSERDALLSPVWDSLFVEEKRRIIRTLVQSVKCEVKNQKMILLFNGSSEKVVVDVKMKTDHSSTIDYKMRALAKEPPIRKILILAHQIRKMIQDGKIKTPREVCPWTHINETRLDQIMNTLFLAPEIQTGILSNDPAIHKVTEYIIRPLTGNVDWDLQSKQWQQILATAN